MPAPVNRIVGPIHRDSIKTAREVLRERPHILSPVNKKFVDASKVVLIIYDHFHCFRKEDIPPGHELPLGSTGFIYRGLLISLYKYRWLWPHIPVDDPESLDENPHFGFFCLVLNKYKTSNGGHFELRTRDGEMDGYPISYATHTHADLTNFMRSYCLGFSDPTFDLANGHDLEEEGQRFILENDNHTIDAKYLVERFPEDNLGIFLAIGIPTLTESKYGIMEDPRNGIDKRTLDTFKACEPVKRLMTESINANPDFKGQIKNLALHTPLEYGGLALQIKRVVEILLSEAKAKRQNTTLSKKQMKLLAKSLIAVEIADRMSDMAELEWFVVTKHSDAPAFGRCKTIFKACRMLNMFEKLQKAIELGGWESEFQDATDGFIAILKAKILEINEHLIKKRQKPIDEHELLSFYYEKFKPAQEQADIAMASFIEKKINRIFRPLYMRCQA